MHGSFIGGDLVGPGGKTRLTEHAFQTQRLPPSSYRQDEIHGDELGGIRGWPSSAWQPDPVDDAGGTIVLAGIEADDTRWPATLFRSGDRDRSDAGTVVRSEVAPDGRFFASVLKLIGLDLAVPDHSTLSRRASGSGVPKKRHDDRIPQSGPVHVLIDSTGLQVYSAGQWLEEKHGVKSRRGWRKLHLALDADSGDIIAHVMTGRDAVDASQVEPLLDQIDRPIGQFTADGAYDGEPTYDAVARHSGAAAVVIPPRTNAWERPDNHPPGQRDRRIAAINADGRMKWRSPPATANDHW